MTTRISVHPDTRFAADREPGALRFMSDRFTPENANAVSLIFPSERGQHEVVLFELSDTDAEILSSVGRLDQVHREELIPILRHMLEDMAAEKEVAAEAEAPADAS